MIHEVDETLRALMRRDVLNGAKVDVSFDAPTKEWAARRQGPSLNLYLYDIREDLALRRVQYVEERDDEGRVQARQMPWRIFKLSYLVTAWTARPEDEHRLLSATLACLLTSDALPPELLQGALADVGEPVRLTIGLPLPQERSIADVWSALGGELKASLDLVVSTPFPARVPRTLEIGPPVIEEPRINLVGREGRAEEARRRDQAAPAASGRRQGGDVAEETVRGGKPGAGGGRRYRLHELPRQ